MRAVLLALALAACAPQPVRDLAQGQTGSIAYRSLMEDVTLTGVLRLPEAPAGPVPVVVIAHGTGGVDGRGARWAAFFLEHGIGSLEIDYFGPRGLRGGVTQRLPTPTHDIYSALKILATHPRVDRQRLAVIGFSRGGAMALDSSNYTESLAGVRTAAHVGLYPWCSDVQLHIRRDLPPVLVLSGAEDHFFFNGSCQAAVRKAAEGGRQATFKAYPGAYHGWDGSYTGAVSYTYTPLEYRIQADAGVTRQSMEDVLAFLRRAMP
ncbi:MAG TPA: dienelactone hydrolase family protein [Burkholderiales bacterium]